MTDLPRFHRAAAVGGPGIRPLDGRRTDEVRNWGIAPVVRPVTSFDDTELS